MRYLLDELMAYEDGFSDIMLPGHLSDRHETFMGDRDNSAPLSMEDFVVFQASMLKQIQEIVPRPMTFGTGMKLFFLHYKS